MWQLFSVLKPLLLFSLRITVVKAIFLCFLIWRLNIFILCHGRIYKSLVFPWLRFEIIGIHNIYILWKHLTNCLALKRYHSVLKKRNIGLNQWNIAGIVLQAVKHALSTVESVFLKVCQSDEVDKITYRHLYFY